MESGKEGKEETPVILDRSSRTTRGKRMTKLLDDEVEEDELFWNQDALKEEENDEEYEEEAEIADVFDSDFDEDEPEPDEEVVTEPVDRGRPKKRLIFPGKTSSNKKKKKKALAKVETTAEEDEKAPEQSTPSEQHHDAPDDVEVEKVIRKSTRTAVIVKQAERDAIRAALQATIKPIKRKKEGEEKRMTQEEMLLEAAQTEIMNLRNLERVLAREEEVKKRAVVHKAVYNGPQIRYLSRDGCSYLEYINGASFESEILTKSSPLQIQKKQSVQSLGCLRSTVILLVASLMLQKKLSRLSDKSTLIKIVASQRKGAWDYCLMQFQGKDFQEGKRERRLQRAKKHQIFDHLLVSSDFLLSKRKSPNSFNTSSI